MADNDKQRQLLFKAVREGNLEMVKRCVEQGVNINCRTARHTPLVDAIKHGFEEIAIHLMDNGADVNLCGGDMPLAAAVSGRQLRVAEKLLKKGADADFTVTEELDSVMTLAAKQSDLPMLKMLHQLGCYLHHKDKKGMTCLHIAAKNDDFEMAKYLVEHGSKVNVRTKDDEAPLHWAAYVGSDSVANYLMDHGADTQHRTFDGDSVLLAATKKCSDETFKRILASGWNKDDRNDRGNVPLLDVIKAGSLEKTKALVEAGGDINVSTGKSNAYIQGIALNEAIDAKSLPIVEYLLNRGADVEQLGKHNQTPLLLAIEKNEMTIADRLIKHGANINYEFELSDELSTISPLLHRVLGNIDAVRFAIKNGVDIDKVDGNGNTALHRAAGDGHVKTVELLLYAGADYRIENNKGRSPSNLAYMNNHENISDMIESFDEQKTLSKTIQCEHNPDALGF